MAREEGLAGKNRMFMCCETRNYHLEIVTAISFGRYLARAVARRQEVTRQLILNNNKKKSLFFFFFFFLLFGHILVNESCPIEYKKTVTIIDKLR